MKVKQIIVTISFSCFSVVTFAHEGHEHNTLSAVLIHLSWLAPVFIAVAVICSLILKKNFGNKSSTTKSHIKE